MKTPLFCLSLAAVTGSLLPGALAGWIYPSGAWTGVTNTLPGSMYKKRDIAEREPTNHAQDARNFGDLYAACGYKNMASRYNGYPINGYAYAAGAVFDQVGQTGSAASAAAASSGGGAGAGAGAGAAPDSGSGAGAGAGGLGSAQGISYSGAAIGNFNGNPQLISTTSNASSAYDCCVQAYKSNNATMFFFTSNPDAFTHNNCIIISDTVCPIPRNQVVVFAAAYNGSETKAKSYGNYIGNGPCGPGVTYALNSFNQSICAGGQGAIAVTNPNAPGAAAAGAGQGCGYTAASFPDQGGNNPAGSGS